MALYRIHSPDSRPFEATPCYAHSDCAADRALAMACAETTHVVDPAAAPQHVWSTRVRWFDHVNDDGTPHIVQCDVWECYAGRVVAKGVDHDVRVMSDVYDNVPWCIVQKADGTYHRFETYSGPGAFPYGYPYPYAEVDASPDMIAAYEVHVAAIEAAREAARRNAEERYTRERAERARKAPAKGRTIRVVKGRKVPIGTQGTCIWIGDGHYGTRVGLKDATGTVHWTSASNVVAIDS